MSLNKTEQMEVYLNNAARERLGDLINSLAVGEIMKSSALERNDFSSFDHWRESEQRATVDLYIEFGVVLPCLDIALGCLGMEPISETEEETQWQT